MRNFCHNQRVIRNYEVIDGEDFLKLYYIGKELGRSNARVFEVKNKADSSKAALKEIRLSDESDTATVKKEVSLLKEIQEKDSSNYFVKFLNYCIIKEEIDSFNCNYTAYILMEKGFGSLQQLIESRKKNIYTFHYFSLHEVLKMLRFFVDSFAFLQNKLNLSHCDIKPENLLLMQENELDFKICDVGAGEILMNEKHTKTKTIKGTIPFLAPELFQDNILKKKSCNPFKADVFSLGLCLIYIATFKKFTKADRQLLNSEIFEETINDWITETFEIFHFDDLCTLLKEMLQTDPKIRPDFKDLQEKLMNIIIGSPQSEDLTNKTYFTWTQNDELSNSYIANTDIMNNTGSSPTKKEKKFVIKKSNDRFKSLHNVTQTLNLLNQNNFPSPKVETPLPINNNTINDASVKIIQKSLSPLKPQKIIPKKYSTFELEETETSPEQYRKARKTENLGSNSYNFPQKSFSIHLKETLENNDQKKSIFGKQNANNKQDSPTKKSQHQKFISNVSDITKFNTAPTGHGEFIFTPRIPIKKNESALFGTNLKDFSIGIKKNESLLGNSESTNNLKTKKTFNEIRKLPPLVLPESSIIRTNLDFKYIANIEEFKTNKKGSFFSSASYKSELKKTLITNLNSLISFKKQNNFFDKNLNIVFDKRMDESEITQFMKELLSINSLESLMIDISLFSSVIDQLKVILLNNSHTLNTFILHLRGKSNDESPLIRAKSISPTKDYVTNNSPELFFSSINSGFLGLKYLVKLEIYLEKAIEIQKGFSSMFTNIKDLENLKFLRVSCKGLGLKDSCVAEMLNQIASHKKIEFFDFFCENNLLTEEFFSHELMFCKNLKSLKLNLSLNKIEFSENKQAILNLPENLESLNLDFEGNGLCNGISLLGTNSKRISLNSLKSLNLNFADTKLKNSSFLNILNEISNLKQIEILNLNIKNNNELNESTVNILGKTIRNDFENLRVLELNFLYLELSINTIKSYLNLANYMCFLKLEFFNLYLFRSITRKVLQDLINQTNKESKFDSVTIYPDLKEAKIYFKLPREKRDYAINKNKEKEVCTFNEVNSFALQQSTFSCLTCLGAKFFHDQGLCSFCIRECHSSHRTFYLGEKRSFCSCYLLNSCKFSFHKEMCSGQIIEGEKMQALYFCKTCGNNGICFKCGMTCHKDHEVCEGGIGYFLCECQKD